MEVEGTPINNAVIQGIPRKVFVLTFSSDHL